MFNLIRRSALLRASWRLPTGEDDQNHSAQRGVGPEIRPPV